MAGLFGMKILLLWAGIISLANCQTPSAPSPSRNSNPTSPPVTSSPGKPIPPSNMTAAPVMSPSTSKTDPASSSYTVSTIQFGLKIDLINSTHGNYSVNITDESGLQTEKTFRHSNKNSSHDIKHLKPCTEYQHAVALIHDDGSETFCIHSRTETAERTTGTKSGDVEKGSCIPGYVCYRSDWDISSLLSVSHQVKECQNDSTQFCFKPAVKDICTSVTIDFTSENCVDPPLNLTQEVPFDSLDETELPPNCEDLTVDYICQEKGKSNEPKSPPELEPFTDYSCTGQIKKGNTTKNTSPITFRVDCDLHLTVKVTEVTNTSIQLSWTTDSQRCKDVLQYPKLGFDCSCVSGYHNAAKKYPGRTSCNVSDLRPYTDYKCQIQPTYDGRNVRQPTSVGKERTKAGKPEDISSMVVTVPENNVINVSCEHSEKFNGPKKIFKASLKNGDTVITQENRKCKFEFRDLSYSTTYRLQVFPFNGELAGNSKNKDVDTLYNDKALIGFLVFLIILTSVALLLVIYKIFILKRRQSHDMSEHIKLIPSNEENLLTVEPIPADSLLEAYKTKLADEGRLFLAEFQSIPRIFSRYSVKEAKKPCNSPKNRYVDILPYDYNRVQLTTGNGEAGCDYINASFIDGYKESKKYIAAQGPKEETVCDFWRMIWEQQSSIIVMVTRCEEGNRVKCAQYWPSPERDTEIFEEFIVKLNSEENCPDYTIRHLSLTNKREKNSEREVTHIQFISWPDHGVPGEPHLLLKLRRRVNAFKNFFSGPIVVHCSAGVGRTGTYIGIDAMMEGLEAEGRVDIYGYVIQLRRQRCLMVQVEAQYILIHQALLEHNQFGETETTLAELHSTVSTLKHKNADNEPTLMEEEFERLPTFKNWRTFNSGVTEENKKKNRSSSVIPYDYNRVLLKLDEGRSHDSDPDEDEEEESSDEEDEESSKYINASHIEGYWGPRYFIAAQTPLPDTMADFWCMIYQKKVSTIVMLSDSSEAEKESDCVYWDKEKKTFGDFEVEVASTDITPTFTTRNMLLRHVKRKESQPVKHFQFLKWGSEELPEKAQNLTDMIKDIKHSRGSGKPQGSSPIVVHCNDGSHRTGVFCALWNVLDSAETEKLVDVFQVVKTLRKERQGMLPSLELYQFLYDALEGVYPVQNGEVKAAQSSAADSVQIVNETKAAGAAAAEQPAEKTEQPASTTSNSQQGAAASASPVSDGGKGDQKEEAGKAPTETSSPEDLSNGPTVTVEV
ncbi:receptor-type tyrosine-protein phosphatase C [Xyrichtys novacula]|uniref:Receptor-type tyrosine-protein phosphatase C n=1 Tax=Xyrichtys novacula TaxID=13765 RepID=A0AAV1FHN6_XYRNO|nr:receptor-type tyrosine-protein phosphatase C [Xyrichtys novacula]